MAKRKLSLLPLWTKPPKTMAQAKRRVLSMLTPSRWIQHRIAMDSSYKTVRWNLNAVKVSLLGAVFRADAYGMLYWKIKDASPQKVLFSFEKFNDAKGRKLSEVRALVKKA